MKLWKARNQDHLTLVEIEAYARLYSIPNPARFADLMLGCDSAIFEAMADIKRKADRVNKLKKLKFNG